MTILDALRKVRENPDDFLVAVLDDLAYFVVPDNDVQTMASPGTVSMVGTGGRATPFPPIDVLLRDDWKVVTIHEYNTKYRSV